MIRLIVAPLLAFASGVGAQTCEYKTVMTDADIEACRNPDRTVIRGSGENRASTGTGQRRLSRTEMDSLASKANLQAADERARKVSDTKEHKANFFTTPTLGMTTDEVRAMNGAWSHPEKVNKTTSLNGTREQWVFEDVNGRPIYFAYFENGVLTSIQQ